MSPTREGRDVGQAVVRALRREGGREGGKKDRREGGTEGERERGKRALPFPLGSLGPGLSVAGTAGGYS